MSSWMRSIRQQSAKPVKTNIMTTKRRKEIEIPADILELEKASAKLHGEGVVVRGKNKKLANHIPTGVFILDFALLGGVAQGYVAMVYGYHSCGKTTRLHGIISEFQKKHPTQWVGLIDAEGMYDPVWAEKNGVNPDRLIVSQPEYGELAVDVYEDMLSRPSIGLIIIDSIPHVVPMKIIENSAEDDTMAAPARLMGKLCSKLTMGNNKERKLGHWVTTLLVNQWRMKVGFVLGNPQTLPGGIQLNHIPTTKIEFKKKKTHLGKDRYGNECAVMDECSFKLEKVKHGQSLRSGEYQLYLTDDNEDGMREAQVDNVPTVVVFGKKMGFITGGGQSWKLLTEDLEAKVARAVAELKARNLKNKKETTAAELKAVADAANCFTKFPSLDGIKKYLSSDEEEYLTLARSLIAAQRVAKGLPALPPDGYLLGIGRLVEAPQVESIVSE